jgi:diaminopimelate dehydrogenase
LRAAGAAVSRRPLAIIGLGRVGLACARAILATEDLAVGGVVRHDGAAQPLPAPLAGVPVAADAGELEGVAAALLCLPPDRVDEAADRLLQHRIPLVEAAILPAPERAPRQERLQRQALRHRTPAVLEAGWDPGMLELFRGLFAVLGPKGHSRTHDRPGVSLHHTLAARALPGIRDALCTELRTAGGPPARYVYVELQPGADPATARDAVRADPLFMDEETVVIPVPSLLELEQEGHGVVLEREALAAGDTHLRFLLEGRFDRVAVTAQVMVAAARALPGLAPGAHRLADIPPSLLWRSIADAQAGPED